MFGPNNIDIPESPPIVDLENIPIILFTGNAQDGFDPTASATTSAIAIKNLDILIYYL